MLTFPRPHVRRFLLLVLQALVLICAVGTVYAPSAAAQFETPNRQFHNQTAFPLEGSHRAVACESCHVRNLYKGTPTKCFDCHWVRRQDDRFRLQLGAQCEQCHQPTRWSNTRWNHSQMTGMALNGAHQQLSCQSCHKNATFKAAQAECISCHQRDYQTAQTPNHVAAGFPTDCATCHRASEASFRQSTFNHNVAFPLVGVHGQQTCASCHKNNVYLGTARDCVGCHRDAYTRTTTPNHAAAGFPTTCESCHRATDQTWRGQSFNHSSIFPLVGLHAQQTCASCHKNNVFRGTPRDCVGCHREAYTRTTTPNHVAAGFSQACETCHKPTDPSWRGPNFNHNAIFPLVGQHGQQTCASCHANNVYKGTARDCVGCHRDEYTRTTAPNHVAAAFPTTCESCHKATDQSWRGAGFNHSSVFPLLGQHAQQSCASCHKNNVYKGTARDCVGCHRDNYTRTTTPNHVAAGFPTTCESCHKATDSNWRGAGFNHSSVFPLVGQHAQQSCASCHTNNVYKGTARDCVGCHRDNYTRTTTPNHAAAGFPTTCESCHKATDSAWRGAGFNHSSVFPLVGQHASQSCASCHTNNVYKGTARDCVGCHRDDYTRTTTPNHASAGFSTACESCHKATDSAWRGVAFNHSTVFPLVGRHAQAACATCHKNNVFKGTPRDCVGCHRDNYTRTTSPNHASAGFGTTCESCHKPTDSGWGQGTFNHRFPITSGPHKQTCVTCHTSSGSYQVFNCLSCHAHERTSMDAKHRNRSGYRYDSLACYSCHQNGKGD